MSFTCSNLPPPLLNGNIARTGNVVDYVCAEGFSMTSGIQRVTCTGPNTWTPNIAPTCTVIEPSVTQVFPTWLAIVCACLLFVILLSCVSLAVVALCCGSRDGGACRRCCRRCCGDRRHRTRPSTASSLDSYEDDSIRYYDQTDRYGNAVYYQNGYVGRRTEPRKVEDMPYVIPANTKQNENRQPQERLHYTLVEPSPLKSKKPSPQKRELKRPRATAVNGVKDRAVDVVHVVQRRDGSLVALDKYLKENPGAQLVTVGDQDVVLQQGGTPRAEVVPTPRTAWKANNKRTPPNPARGPRDQTATDRVVVMVVNDLNDRQPELDTDTQTRQAIISLQERTSLLESLAVV